MLLFLSKKSAENRKDLNGFNESMNSYMALSLVATDLSSRQQEIALKIFKTGRLKNRNKSKMSR